MTKHLLASAFATLFFIGCFGAGTEGGSGVDANSTVFEVLQATGTMNTIGSQRFSLFTQESGLCSLGAMTEDLCPDSKWETNMFEVTEDDQGQTIWHSYVVENSPMEIGPPGTFLETTCSIKYSVALSAVDGFDETVRQKATTTTISDPCNLESVFDAVTHLVVHLHEVDYDTLDWKAYAFFSWNQNDDDAELADIGLLTDNGGTNQASGAWFLEDCQEADKVDPVPDDAVIPADVTTGYCEPSCMMQMQVTDLEVGIASGFAGFTVTPEDCGMGHLDDDDE